MHFNRAKKVHIVVDSLRQGKQFVAAVHEAGIRSCQTWYNWESKKPRLKRLREAAQELCESKRTTAVVDALFKSAIGGNVGAMAFYLKNKAGWKDSPSVVVETGTQVKTPHAIIFSAVKEDCNVKVKDGCQNNRV